MRRMLAAMIIPILGSQALHAQTSAAPLVFAAIPWGSSVPEVKSALSAKGYEFTEVLQDGDVLFKGTIANTPTVIRAMFDPSGHLVKVYVGLVTPDETARNKYESVSAELEAKYGVPKLSQNFFDSPYYAGDGYEDQAIRLGKAHFAKCWERDVGRPSPDGLCIDVSKSLNVELSYESAAWNAEADRRLAKSTKDL